MKERLEQLDETIQIIKAMWTEESPAFSGKHFKVYDAFNNPRPVQQPHPPIMLGGSGTGLLKIAAREATVLNIIPPTSNGKDFPNDPEATVRFTEEVLKQRVALLHELMAAEGRDPNEIELGGPGFAWFIEGPRRPGTARDGEELGICCTTSRPSVRPWRCSARRRRSRDELKRRVAETGVTYYIMLSASDETQDLFVSEVMPHF